MFRDRLQEALERAARPTLERIRRDRERMPPQLSALLAYIEENLFDPQLTVKSARAAVGAHGSTLPAQFRAHTDTSIKVYIETARLEVADRLLRLGRFEVGRVSMAVGYSNHETFLRAYKPWAGELPSVVGAKPKAPEIDYPTWRRAWRGELDPEEARDFLEKYLRVYPDAGRLLPADDDDDAGAAPAPRVDADGERYERFRAREIWRRIRDLPEPAQRRWLRHCDFRTTALFDLLREVSREEGRRDRRRGIRIARLALVTLEEREEIYGERIHDLRALGHAWLGNAYRLALDFPAADAEFERAEGEWRVPRGQLDLFASAEIAFLEAALRILQRSYEEASQLVERSQDLFRLAHDPVGQAKTLLQRAAIYSYTGDPEDSIATLQAASALVDAGKDPHLIFAVHCNLANEQAKVGRYRSAVENLNRARDCRKKLADPLGLPMVQWIDGMIKQGTGELSMAESRLVAARDGYSEAEELTSFGIVSIDLAILYAKQNRWQETLRTVAEAVPILESLKLCEETLAALRLLAQAIEVGELSSSLLQQVRNALRQDPLVGLAP